MEHKDLDVIDINVQPCKPCKADDTNQEMPISRTEAARQKKAQKKLAKQERRARRRAERARRKANKGKGCAVGETSRDGILPTPAEEECPAYCAAIAEDTLIEETAKTSEVSEVPAETSEPKDTDKVTEMTDLAETQQTAETAEESKVAEVAEEEQAKQLEVDKKYFTDMTGKFSRFEIFVDKGGDFRFNMIASNGEIVGVSQGYKSKAGCKNGIASVIRYAPSPIVDTLRQDYSPQVGKAVFEVYKSNDNKFRFRLRAANFRPILASQGYTTKANCLKGIASVKNIAHVGNITDTTR